MKDPVFFITSAIDTKHSAFTSPVRFEQTLESINSVKKIFPEAKIILLEMSTKEINKNWRGLLDSQIDCFIDFLNFEEIYKFYKLDEIPKIKNLTESFCLRKGLEQVKDLNLIQAAPRCFKLSGRYSLTTEFNLNIHLNNGFTFLKPKPSKFKKSFCPIRMEYMCRLYSWNPKLTENLINVLKNTYNHILEMSKHKQYVDIEHSFYKFFDQSIIHETDVIGVQGKLNQIHKVFIKE